MSAPDLTAPESAGADLHAADVSGADLSALGGRPARTGERRPVVVTSTASDAHTWNLVFLQLLIEELGYPVVNLGPCVPDELVLRECHRVGPELVVVSTVNGHGARDGERLIRRLRGPGGLGAGPVVIGGKLGVDGESHAAGLIEAGFDAVFEDRDGQVAQFRDFLRAIGGGPRSVRPSPAGVSP